MSRHSRTLRVNSLSRLFRPGISFHNSEQQSARFGAGGKPADTGDRHLRFDDGSTVLLDSCNACVKVRNRYGHLGQRPAATRRRISDCADTAINAWFAFCSRLDSVVVVRHRELLESPIEDVPEKGLSLLEVFDCEIKISGFHMFNIPLKFELANYVFHLLLSFPSGS